MCVEVCDGCTCESGVAKAHEERAAGDFSVCNNLSDHFVDFCPGFAHYFGDILNVGFVYKNEMIFCWLVWIHVVGRKPKTALDQKGVFMVFSDVFRTEREDF